MTWLLWPEALFAALFIEWFFSTWTFLGATPQAALVATAAVAVLRGPVAGESFGFVAGLLTDALGTHLFGANALALTLIGYGVGTLRRQVDTLLAPSQMALVALLSWVQFLFVGALGSVFEGSFFGRLLPGLLLVPLYNALLAPVAFRLLRRLRR